MSICPRCVKLSGNVVHLFLTSSRLILEKLNQSDPCGSGLIQLKLECSVRHLVPTLVLSIASIKQSDSRYSPNFRLCDESLTQFDWQGFRALYKGATPPAVGWTAIDSVLLGSLHNYRLFLMRQDMPGLVEYKPGTEIRRLTVSGHGIAGFFAGLSRYLSIVYLVFGEPMITYYCLKCFRSHTSRTNQR